MASTLSAYNTRDSPFLDLDSPFTAWYARSLANWVSAIEKARKTSTRNSLVGRLAHHHRSPPKTLSTSTSPQ